MSEPNKFELWCQNIADKLISGKLNSKTKAIRAKCLDCMCFQYEEVNRCPSMDCPLWVYRRGGNSEVVPTKKRPKFGLQTTTKGGSGD